MPVVLVSLVMSIGSRYKLHTVDRENLELELCGEVHEIKTLL